MTYVKMALDDQEDQAARYGIESQQARFYRKALGASAIGMASYKVRAGGRFEFGHRHRAAEEIYLVLSGSGRFKVDDEVVDVGPRDVLYVLPEQWRCWEAGPDGMELLAFGAHAESDNEMDPDFWS